MYIHVQIILNYRNKCPYCYNPCIRSNGIILIYDRIETLSDIFIIQTSFNIQTIQENVFHKLEFDLI